MVRTIGQLDAEIDDREANQVPAGSLLAEALFNRRDIFARDVPALDHVFKDHALTAFTGDHRHLDAAELA